MLYIENVYNILSANPSLAVYSDILCKISWPTHTVIFTAGANILIVISMVRYRAIVQPFKLAMSRRTVKVLSIFVYVFATICIIPFVLVLKFDETSGCTEDWPLNSLNIAYRLYHILGVCSILYTSRSPIYYLLQDM